MGATEGVPALLVALVTGVLEAAAILANEKGDAAAVGGDAAAVGGDALGRVDMDRGALATVEATVV